jgi:pyruvate-ferredoxin/flavodoxin oxidoreductase
MASENRFRMLRYSHPEQARALTNEAQEEVQLRWERYQRLAQPGEPAP